MLYSCMTSGSISQNKDISNSKKKWHIFISSLSPIQKAPQNHPKETKFRTKDYKKMVKGLRILKEKSLNLPKRKKSNRT